MKNDNLIEKLKVAVFDKIIPEIIKLKTELYERTIIFDLPKNTIKVEMWCSDALMFYNNDEWKNLTKGNTTNSKFIIEFSKSAKKKLDELRKEKQEILEIINVQIPYKKKLLTEKFIKPS